MAEFLGFDANDVAGKDTSLFINSARLFCIITYSIAKFYDYPFAGMVRLSSCRASEFDRSKVGCSMVAVAELLFIVRGK